MNDDTDDTLRQRALTSRAAHAALDSVPPELLGNDDTDDEQMPELEPDPMAQTG